MNRRPPTTLVDIALARTQIRLLDEMIAFERAETNSDRALIENLERDRDRLDFYVDVETDI